MAKLLGIDSACSADARRPRPSASARSARRVRLSFARQRRGKARLAVRLLGRPGTGEEKL